MAPRYEASAKSEGRPVFNHVLELIRTGKADALVCWKLDRLARNFIDGGRVIDLLQKSVIQEIRTYEGTHLPSDNVLMIAMQFGMANQYSRDLSMNVKRGNRTKLERGEWPHRAKFGYLNDKATKTITLHPTLSKYIVRMFELYKRGTYSFQEVADIIFAEGIRTVSGKKLFAGHIKRLLSSPFYMGIMLRNGKYYPGKHTALISKETFDTVQDIMHKRTRPRPQTLFFPLRGFLTCETCGCALTSSLKKGHHYYYCTNGKGICAEHKSYMRETYLYEKVAPLLEALHFTEAKIELMYEAALEESQADSGHIETALATLQNRLESLITRESRLLDTFLAEQTTQALYDEKSLELKNEKVSLEKQIEELKAKQPLNTLEPTKNLFLRASRTAKQFLEGDDMQKREMLENVLWNLTIKNKETVIVQYKSPFDIMAKAPKNGDFLQMRRM